MNFYKHDVRNEKSPAETKNQSRLKWKMFREELIFAAGTFKHPPRLSIKQ